MSHLYNNTIGILYQAKNYKQKDNKRKDTAAQLYTGHFDLTQNRYDVKSLLSILLSNQTYGNVKKVSILCHFEHIWTNI